MVVSDAAASGLIVGFGVTALVTAYFFYRGVKKVPLPDSDELQGLLGDDTPAVAKVAKITKAIQRGATSFLNAEYTIMLYFIVIFGLILFLCLGFANSWANGGFTFISFAAGGLTSMASGYIGMKIAVFANGRTALEAREGLHLGFMVAFKAGAVMGFALCGVALLVLFVLIVLFKQEWSETAEVEHLYEAITGYGLGGSSIALFGRVGGGIYTKAADVGADLVGKVEQGIPEDDPRNPGTIADNVGDNVGDVAGMGADLFGSFAESTCAALVVASEGSPEIHGSWAAMSFPLMISATGIMVCLITSLFCIYGPKVNDVKQIEPTLKRQLLISTVIMTPLVYAVCVGFLPAHFVVSGKHTRPWKIFFCVAVGLWSGLLIGYITEYFTSHAYKPVRDVSHACKTGAATNIIYGLALGYKSAIIPATAISVAIYFSFHLAGMFGVACAALGILSTLSIGLTIDVYGPISDNAGGIAEMAGLGKEVRDRTDALDAAGNTTAAIGKGFAIGSAAFVSLALFGAFTVRADIDTVNILEPFQFAGLLFGAMLPYWFSAMTMKAVGKAALDMVNEVRRQFKEIPGIMTGESEPDYEKCVAISTQASLKEMLGPGALVMITPLFVGFVFGTDCLAGMLAGAIVSGVNMAISSSNTGGAWDNAKKYIEAGAFGGKGSEPHKAAVVGDTVGDPLKDTSGPSLNILIKLMAVESLVFAPFFKQYGGLLD